MFKHECEVIIRRTSPFSAVVIFVLTSDKLAESNDRQIMSVVQQAAESAKDD